jgi:hypothetical protein
VMAPELATAAKSLGIWPGKNVNASMADVARQMKTVKAGEAGKVGLSAYFLNRSRKPEAGSQKGKGPKAAASSQYPYSGYTFFRSAWSADADYLAVSHYPPNIPGTHSHWDTMSFLLHTKGRTLIGDPASQLYGDPRFHGHGGRAPESTEAHTHHRGYSYSVNAHNCLVMNDDFLKPLEAMDHGTFWGGFPPECGTGIFESGGPIEVSEVWHDANAPTRIRRFFVHLKGIGFVFVDIVTSSKKRMSPMQYSQYFHFEGDVEISPEAPEAGGAMRVWQDEASCWIVPGKEMETHWRSFRDSYLNDTYMVPATKGLPWIGELTRRIRGDGVFSTFLLTHCDKEAAPIGYLGTKPSAFFDWHHEAISANKVHLGERGSMLVASAPFGKKVESAQIQTDAELAVVLLEQSGKVRSWGMARGSHLSVGGRVLHHDRVREWLAK